MLVRGGSAAILTVAALALAGCGLFGGGKTPGGEACLDELHAQHVAFTPAVVHASASACTVDNPVRVTEAGMNWTPAGVLSCGFAERFDTFLSGTAESLARRRLGASITTMRQLGTYSCRHMVGGKHMSLHASGRAIDVAGFFLSNGEFVSVQHDWHGAGRKSEFLHEFARAACAKFGVVLTPDANKAHFNHIHIDSSRYRVCGVRRADGTLPPELATAMAEAGEGAPPSARDESVADTGGE
jgi:hypothetical protein